MKLILNYYSIRLDPFKVNEHHALHISLQNVSFKMKLYILISMLLFFSLGFLERLMSAGIYSYYMGSQWQNP